MLNTCPCGRLLAPARASLAALALLALGGCAHLAFHSTRQSHFIDMDGRVVDVEYGKERRTETLPNGLVCTFEGKVRIRLPEGGHVVLYQALAPSGVRYVSANKKYEFVEMGPYCTITSKGVKLYEGFYFRK